ncbi:MAG: hydrogenase maturation nickel metallochaperone HypA [Nanoarchaeota archaeon]|nr:hydrogenase maturation nickel metallochaperone HypA [Nanoarchaeota archaeon]
MHEYAFAQQIYEYFKNKKNVKNITLKIGTQTSFNPKIVQEYFTIIIKNTDLEKTRLKFKTPENMELIIESYET